MLTEQELSQIRLDVLETLLDTVVILSPATTISDAGDAALVYTAVETTIGRVDRQPYRFDNEFGETLVTRELYFLSLPYDTSVEPDYRYEVNGITYETTQVFDGVTANPVLRVRVARIQ